MVVQILTLFVYLRLLLLLLPFCARNVDLETEITNICARILFSQSHATSKRANQIDNPSIEVNLIGKLVYILQRRE